MVLCGTDCPYHPPHRRTRHVWGEKRSRWCELENYVEDWQVLLIVWSPSYNFNSLSPHFYPPSKYRLNFEVIFAKENPQAPNRLAWLGIFYFSPTIVHFQICDFEKVRRGWVPGTEKLGCCRDPCQQLPNSQRKRCLSFPELEFRETRETISIASKGSVSHCHPVCMGMSPLNGYWCDTDDNDGKSICWRSDRVGLCGKGHNHFTSLTNKGRWRTWAAPQTSFLTRHTFFVVWVLDFTYTVRRVKNHSFWVGTHQLLWKYVGV